MKYTYEFITPSDPITFQANDDKVALYCAMILGSGKAGCRRFADGNEIVIPSLQIFNENAIADVEAFLECDLKKFADDRFEEIIACYNSFTYGDFESRATFDDAIAAITDDVKLKVFKARHEDRNRTSMSQWVKYAWLIGEGMKKKYKPAEA